MDHLHGYYLEDLSVGQSAVFTKTVTEADIVFYGGVVGDTNPVHMDEEYAKKTMFGGRIAHGMLSASYLSTVLGTKLPGPGCVYMSQNLKFKAPVKIGDTVTARVVVKEIITEKKRVVLETNVYIGEKIVIEGEAMVMVDSKK